MGKKKKNTTVALRDFCSLLPEQQTEAYKPPSSAQTRSTEGSGRGTYSDREYNNEKSGNRKNFENKEDVVLDFKLARNTRIQISPQQEQQQPPKQLNDRSMFNRIGDNRGGMRNQGNTELGPKKVNITNSPTQTKPQTPPTPSEDIYVAPGKRNQLQAVEGNVQPPSISQSSRFSKLIEKKPEVKVEEKKTPLEVILSGFSRGTDLVNEVFRLEPVPSLIDITVRILNLVAEKEIYSFTWISENRFKPLFEEYIHRNEGARLFLIIGAQKFACNKHFSDDKNGLSLLSALLFSLYKEDLIYESDISNWKTESQYSVQALKSKALDSCSNFLFWLENVEAEN